MSSGFWNDFGGYLFGCAVGLIFGLLCGAAAATSYAHDNFNYEKRLTAIRSGEAYYHPQTGEFIYGQPPTAPPAQR